MKKLLMAIVIATSAIALNAATVTWGLTNITDSEANAAKAGMAAYFMDAATYNTFTANVAALADGTMESGDFISYVTGNKTYDTATVLVSGRTGLSINISQASGNYAAGSTVNGYIVLFDTASAADASYFAYTATKSATVGDVGAPITLSYGSFAAGTQGGWTAVPEPTSGLLVILGMAGLALRRKQA